MSSYELSDQRFEPLSSDDQKRISDELTAAIAAGDERRRRKLRDELIERHMRLVASIGRGYEQRLDREEILSVGALALTEAMDRWSPAPGGMSAYQWAKRWITTALNKAVSADRQIRIPNEAAYRAAVNTRTVREREALLGRQLSKDEIADLTGGGVRLEDLPLADRSLDAPVSPYADDSEARTLEEVTPDETAVVDADIERDEVYASVRDALAILTEDELQVVSHRFGLGGAEGMTLAELGDVLGISGEAVRRLEASALAKLNHPANRLGLGVIP